MKNLLKITMPVLAVMILASMLPRFLPLVDTSRFTDSYRIPYSMGEDYFLYEKYVDTVAGTGRIAVIGDSVIWGHYTDDAGTLPAQLDAAAGPGRFANIGIDGIHPAALYGLVENYCGGLRNGKIVVGINLLWMSSAKHDLSGGVNHSINHKALLPQTPGRIPAYSPSVEERLTSVARRDIPLLMWIDHVRASRFADRNLYRWTMNNPYAGPREYLVFNDEKFNPPDPVQPGRMTPRDMEWVQPANSLQWKYMLASITRLREQGNSIIAVVTPFNQFMLTEKSRLDRDMIISYIQAELGALGITAFVPVLDKPEYFADLSHPVAAGYGIIASQLMADSRFAGFVK